jgi:hypothetical protein
MRQCSLITQEAKKGKTDFEFFLTVHCHVFESFWPKNCQNSVMVIDNLTIPTAMSS